MRGKIPIIADRAIFDFGLTVFAVEALLRLRQAMANEPIFLTVDEASSLKAAVDIIVATGIKVQDTEHQILAVKAGEDGVNGLSAEKPEGPAEGGL